MLMRAVCEHRAREIPETPPKIPLCSSQILACDLACEETKGFLPTSTNSINSPQKKTLCSDSCVVSGGRDKQASSAHAIYQAGTGHSYLLN